MIIKGNGMNADSGINNKPQLDSRELAARWAVPEMWISELAFTSG
jgi:hypothetical protein